MVKLNPQIIEKDGKEAFAVLTWDEFTALREQLDDLIDVVELRTAKADNESKPTKSLEEVAAELGIDPTGHHA